MLALAGFLLIAVGPLAVRYGLASPDAGLWTVAVGVLLAVLSVAAAIRTALRTGHAGVSLVVVLAAAALAVPAWTVARAWLTPAAADGAASASTRILTGDPLQTFGRAGRAAQDVGWTIVQVDEADGRIEAAHTSRWFRLIDDVEIRVRPEGDRDQVRVDVRSRSRTPVGQPWRSLLRLDAGGTDPRTTAIYFRRLASLR